MGRESTCSQVPPVLVRQAEPVFQQPAALGGFSVGALVQGAEVRAIGCGGHLGAEDYDVEVLAVPVVIG